MGNVPRSRDDHMRCLESIRQRGLARQASMHAMAVVAERWRIPGWGSALASIPPTDTVPTCCCGCEHSVVSGIRALAPGSNAGGGCAASPATLLDSGRCGGVGLVVVRHPGGYRSDARGDTLLADYTRGYSRSCRWGVGNTP